MSINIDWSKAPEGATGAMVAHFDSRAIGGSTFPGKIEFVCGDGDRRCFREGIDFWEFHPAPKPWQGKGLPPVGTVCEIKRSPQWTEVEVIAHYEGRAVIAFDGDVELRCHFDLRTIRTPEQIAREEEDRAIASMVTDSITDNGEAIWSASARKLYRAGYRKQVAP